MTDASGLEGSYSSGTLFQNVDDNSVEAEGWFGGCPKGVARKRTRPINELVSDSSESSISDATAIRWYEAFQSRVASSRPTLRSSNSGNHLLDIPHALRKQFIDTTVTPRGGDLQDGTDVPSCPGRYLHVHDGVATLASLFDLHVDASLGGTTWTFLKIFRFHICITWTACLCLP